MKKTITNLIKKYGTAKLIDMIKDVECEILDREEYDRVFDTDENALEYFKTWAETHKVELHNPHYNGNRWEIKGIDCSGTYAYLWLSENRPNSVSRPHFEMGDTLENLWNVPHSLHKIDKLLFKVLEENGQKVEWKIDWSARRNFKKVASATR